MGTIALRRSGDMEAESCARQAEQHRLLRGEIGIDVRCVTLRHIPDALIGLACRFSKDFHIAVRQREQPELGFHHGRLAGTIGSDDGGDRSARD